MNFSSLTSFHICVSFMLVSVFLFPGIVSAQLDPTTGAYRSDSLPAAEAALINQRSQETLETAREVSPHSNASSIAYFQEQINAAVERATGGRIWDPMAPRDPSPRTPWGDPELGGYWLSLIHI